MKCLENSFHVSRALQIHDDVLAEKGVKLLIGFDFDEYAWITRTTPTKEPIEPNFRPDLSPINPGEGYWIMGVDKENAVAILAAQRLYDLSGSNLAEHFQSLKAFYADPAVHANRYDRCTCRAPSAKTITGKVAYHGDYWIREDFRGQGMSAIIARVTHGLSFAMWAPEFLCALVERWALDKGLVAQYACAHHEADVSILVEVEAEIVDYEYWLIWRTGEELWNEFDRHNRNALILSSPFPPTRSGAT
ncbi:hypothetical protein [Bradyrhizobium valentinum]|uniref:N-acetyltransferase domain-containing protein n=1 Tax=Bradyrhizobium valentinum TaxID=1518501 RepID=A0A0R3KDI4_9BRAD|nr:hypothetical protein [Bradyrhizobium valentinum]KRQ93593.1 hypothetical protein CP49_26230 [Bradyrhizobium valentinum]